MTPTQIQFDSAGMRINAWEWPAAGQPLLLLIHGGRDQARSWDFVAERLTDQFHVIAPDLRGHGDSEWSNEGQYDLADFVADSASVLLSLPSPVQLVGHSLGGNIALRLAAICPERVERLVAIEGLELPLTRDAAKSREPLARRFRHWLDNRLLLEARRPPLYASVEEAADRMAREFPQLDRAMIDHLALHSVRAIEGGFTWKFDNRTRLRPPIDSDSRDFDSLLTSINCPTLLLYGGKSWVPVPDPKRLALIHDLSLMRHESAGHWLHHDNPDRFASDIAAFLLHEKAPHA
jgi:pimeloyl-ACP methyl ester carboxylesterase